MIPRTSPTCFLVAMWMRMLLLVLVVVLLMITPPVSSSSPEGGRLWIDDTDRSILVVGHDPSNSDEKGSFAAVARQNMQRFASTTTTTTTTLFYTTPQQQQYLQQHCPTLYSSTSTTTHTSALTVFAFQVCASLKEASNYQTIVFIDTLTTPLLVDVYSTLLKKQLNIAVLSQNDPISTLVHPSFLVLQSQNVFPTLNPILPILSENIHNPMLIGQTLYALIAEQQQQSTNHDWLFLQHSCHLHDNTATCPQTYGFCCSIYEPTTLGMVAVTRDPVYPQINIPLDQLPRPFAQATNDHHYHPDDELPYIATIRQDSHTKPDNFPETPNFYEMLMVNQCLPDDETCSKCLRDKKGANCQSCASVCSCYCKTLCHERIPEKFVAHEWLVTPPLYRKSPSRLVPRIVHQTWYEDLHPDKYPNMSRLVESFKQSGWEYKFYSDEAAQEFLSTHFPPQVREAYDTLRPGAFKADLFRYCALLIHGGVYADVDIMLESNLDVAIPPEVGFMVPIDEPGMNVNHRMCLWNGLIAAAPGHPVLAKAIETVVNQVRNRFTSVDVDATFCPNPELSVLHAFDTLFSAGPCLLGASLNRYLGRNSQQSFEDGKLVGEHSLENGSDFGEILILHQDKWDMGSHRFSDVSRNLVIAATDMEDSDDRAKDDSGKTEHYSKTHAKTGVYGLTGVYTDNVKADENVRIHIVSPKDALQQ